MRKLWLHYAQNGNMGDMLNLNICKNLFNMEVRDSSTSVCESVFVGSIMDDFLGKKSPILKRIYPVKVWGTGFIADSTNDSFFRKMEVYAVRGAKTLNRLKKAPDIKIVSEVLGDPGILASELITKTEKKYDLGIVPHYIDKTALPQISLPESSYKIIDVNNEPIECVKQISQCRAVLSSSLHGMIIADSFNIPNKRMIISEILGNYKYEDYYSAYGIEQYKPMINIEVIDQNVIDKIVHEYEITARQVDKIKNNLLLSFPYR